jgi:4-hydroxy-3-methylbut-2-enyl diphosphate reductase
MKILPATYRFRRLSDLPGSKNISTALAWSIVTAVLPALHTNTGFSAAMAVAFLFTFGLVFIRSAMPDIMEMQSDKLLGRETIPVVIGKEKTQIILKAIAVILFVILLISHHAGWTPALSYFLISCPLYIWICLRVCDRRAGFSGAFLEGVLQTSFIIAGFAVFCWRFLI